MRIGGWLRVLTGNWGGRQRMEQLRQAVLAHLNVLPVANAQLLETNRQVEQAVAQVGRNFQRIAESARQGTDQASHLVGAAGGQGEGVEGLLSSTRTTLEDMLGRIVSDSEVCRRLTGRMAVLEQDMARIVRALEAVDRISFGNTILALNAKIEAAHLGDRGHGFELVAQELWHQSRRSEEITDEIRGTIGRLAGDAKAASVEVSGMTCADGERIASMQAQVYQALDRLKDAHEQTGQAMADGVARNQALSGEIAAAVQAMQFQDRVSQQVAHIVEALEAMQTAISLPLGLAAGGDAGSTGTGSAPAADLLAMSYTMESERNVHAAITGQARASEEVGDDVEFF